MNKRITAILLCFVMVFSMLVPAAPTFAATYQSTTITVAPDKTTANPGDIITYTITMGPVSDMGSMQMVLDIPTGVTYVGNSAKLADGLKTTLGFDTADWTEVSKMINGVASAADYECDTDTVLATFQCKVNNDFTGTVSVGLTNLEFGSCQTFEYLTQRFSVVPTVVTVEAAPVAVTGVTIDETLSLTTGQSKTPNYTVNPAEATNKTVSFKSDNTDVATVNETTGEVTGIKEGTATITITTADGNFTDTCVVTVECSHANKTPVAEQASDCKNQGWDAYVKCDACGQLFKADAKTEIAEIPYRALSQQHTGGTATCTAQAVCTVCSQPYGNTVPHDYTAETKKAEALKTEGNCNDKAVYYYSCSVCGKVENNDSHIFLGNKDADNHVGGTTLVNQAAADHKTQTDGYTGDTKCLGCGEIIGYGQAIPAGAHTPANNWSADDDNHWKECTVNGCGIVIDGTKAEHTSTGANVATCQKTAVCDVCGVSYGTVAAHDWNTSAWEKDATGHWHKCNTAGCTEKNAFAAHTPDHQGGATEEYAVECSVCGYEIEAQLGHTHVFDKEVVAEQYLASKANCTEAAKYFKSCKCGEKGTVETFTSGDALGHTEGTEWKYDDNNHWHICTVENCGVVIESSKAAHTPDHQGGATEEYAVKCSVCEYEIEAQLGHTHVFDKEVVAEQYLASKANCTEAAKYFKSCKCGEKGTVETFTSGDALGHTEGTEWKYDETNHWHICTVENCGVVIESSKAAHTPDHQGGATEEYAVKCSVCGYEMEAQLGHTHVFDKEVVAEQYLASKANCTEAAKYFKSCKCGEKGTETFTSGDALGHTEGTEWKYDETNHWHICTVENCGVVIESSKAAHTPDRAEATETEAVSCTECGYVIAPALGHTHVYATEWSKDSQNHWKECGCGDKKEVAAHVYDNSKDAECNVCGYTRTVSSGSSSGGGFTGKYNYPVVIADNDDADVTASKNYAVAGDKVTVTVDPAAGKQVDEVIVTDADGDIIPVTKAGDNQYTFTMPAGKVNVAVVTEAADYDLRIVMQINNKNILVNGKTKVNDVAPVIVDDRTLVPVRVVTELLGGTAAWDNETRTVTLKIEGKTMSMTIGKPIPGFGTSAVILDNRTYVPVRYVAEKLGANVDWIGATRQIIIEK